MSRRGEKAPSQRQLRVGEEIRHTLAMILERGELRDPGLKGASITVTEVRATPDLRHAHVYVMPLGGGDRAEALQALKRARPFLRRHISKALTLKFSPDLHFALDETFDESDRIGALLRDPHVAQDTVNEARDDTDSGSPDE